MVCRQSVYLQRWVERTTYLPQKMKTITNGVLLERIDNLISTNSEAHDKLIEQTTRTNGRVSALEAWKNIASGVILVANIIIVPVMLYLLYIHIVK